MVISNKWRAKKYMTQVFNLVWALNCFENNRFDMIIYLKFFFIQILMDFNFLKRKKQISKKFEHIKWGKTRKMLILKSYWSFSSGVFLGVGKMLKLVWIVVFLSVCAYQVKEQSRYLSAIAEFEIIKMLIFIVVFGCILYHARRP